MKVGFLIAVQEINEIMFYFEIKSGHDIKEHTPILHHDYNFGFDA